ncbi:tigger transposable element-derived protein 6-like [Euwallacea fornicatus]|uniref:tigger transposable element-derived protein 6-like n=1 Tax=Euwallacea fornicatus TaxID=995702 RepID=UPI00338EE9AF
MAPTKRLLTLKEKLQVVEVYDREKLSVRNLAARFNIGKTQASEIIKKREQLLNSCVTSFNSEQKRSFFKTKGFNIDKLTYEWFVKARNKNFPISGPIIRSKAKELAEKMGYQDFRASSGWLEKFRIRHNITFRSISGEAATVNTEHVAIFKNNISVLLKHYEPRNIYNADETGLFFRALPEKTFALKGEKCAGGKMAKERLTILHCTNMASEKEKLLVIGKSARPRCFKKLDLRTLPVTWYSNNKSWMTSNIMTEWLQVFDHKMAREKRKILLFMDNAASHPRDLNLQNIKIIFLPPNTTALCQPLDQGIIKNFKICYRSIILRHILIKMDSVNNANELAKCINVLEAVFFIHSAWKQVSSTTIKNCFTKAGFRYEVTPISGEGWDPDDEVPLSKLAEVCKMMRHAGHEQTDTDAFINVDNAVQVEDQEMEVSISNENTEEIDSEDESDTMIYNNNMSDSKIHSYSDAFNNVNKLKEFSLKNSDLRGFEMLSKLEIHFEEDFMKKKTRQTSITEYFTSKL